MIGVPPWSRIAPPLVSLALAACGGLPESGDRTPSAPLQGNGHTALAAAVRPYVAANPGKSGIHPLADGRDAFAARLALADAAQRSLDVQYYIWNNDMSGKVLIEHLLRAADRGVRVRMLLDDFGVSPSDRGLNALDSHPNVEVRMFNPITTRSARLLGTLLEFERVNRRMHNKAFIADGQVAIVGGRNIGDEYFSAHGEMNFADLDVAAIGPVVSEVADSFDLYWNSSPSIPIAALSRYQPAEDEVDAKRAALSAHHAEVVDSAYADSLRDSGFARQYRNRALSFYWGRAWAVYDHPDKVTTSADDTSTHLAPRLGEVIGATNRELFLVSPYFVPGKEGVAGLAGVRRRGARVVVLTNSLASTDGTAVHAGYRRYRKPLLRAGVELCELKAATGAERDLKLAFRGGSSGAALHAKAFTTDRRILFVGSYNLDPRSKYLNTEVGILFDCPELAARLPLTTEHDIESKAYRLELEGNRLVWVTLEDGKEVRFDFEPAAGLWKRFQTSLLGLLPIEDLL